MASSARILSIFLFLVFSFFILSVVEGQFLVSAPAYADWTLDSDPPTTTFDRGANCTLDTDGTTFKCPTATSSIITLICTDTGGSGGCSSNYFVVKPNDTDLCDPIPATVPGTYTQYSTTSGISVSGTNNTKKKICAFSIDLAGNVESPKSQIVNFSNSVTAYQTCRNDGTNYNGFCGGNPPTSWLQTNNQSTPTAPSCASGTWDYAGGNGDRDCGAVGSGWYCYTCRVAAPPGGGGGTFGKASPAIGANVVTSTTTLFSWNSYTPPLGQPAGAYRLIVCAGAANCSPGVVNQCTANTSYSVPANTLSSGRYWWQVYWGPNADCSGPIAYYSPTGWKTLASIDPLRVMLNLFQHLVP